MANEDDDSYEKGDIADEQNLLIDEAGHLYWNKPTYYTKWKYLLFKTDQLKSN